MKTGDSNTSASKNGSVRLHKYIAAAGIASRRRAEELIQAGKVQVNGSVVATAGVKVDPTRDRVAVKGRLIRPAHKGLMLLNKPRGVLTTLDPTEERRTIAQYLTKKTKSYFPVGRLDLDSSGLLILTNDGDLAERLTHPRYQLPRVYRVKVRGIFDPTLTCAFSQGIRLADGVAKATVALIEQRESAAWLEVTVKEGRNRLVRRMLETVHHPVVKLHRVAHGPIRLGGLKNGEVRKFTESEYRKLRGRLLKAGS